MNNKLLAICYLLAPSVCLAAVPEAYVVNYGSASTVIKVLDDDLIHISFRHHSNTNGAAAINNTAMVFKKKTTPGRRFTTPAQTALVLKS